MRAVTLEGVTKQFGSQTAVRDLDLEIPEGSIYGFIGPNGSGKTTTLRMILNIIHPDKGRVEVLGQRGSRSANDSVGYLPEERGLYRKMTASRLLAYFGTLKGMPASEARSEAVAWMDRLGLGDAIGKKVEALSKGMAQKVQFIAAAIGRPRLLVLDEPFSGLDPVNLDVVRDQILRLRENGTTVIFSTHDMAAAEALCDSVFMIYRGEKVLDGPLQEIAPRGRPVLRISCKGGPATLRTIPGLKVIRDLGRFQDVSTDRPPNEVLRELSHCAEVQHFEVKHASLHDIFVEIANPAPGEVGEKGAAG